MAIDKVRRIVVLADTAAAILALALPFSVPSILLAWVEVFTNLYLFIYCYGAVGCIVWVFGSNAIWKIQQQVLLSRGEKIAMDFKVSMQNENNMIAVAVRSSLPTVLTSLIRS